ncbi:MAG: hypothetical protein JO273_22235 [Methylobacteriaceae bacterium]|nr:hypothetical protein [Methylobacteriaceae bacterium]
MKTLAMAVMISAGALVPQAPAQQSPIIGVWRAVSPPTVDPSTGLSIGAVFTTAFSADGSFRTEILSQGGNGVQGASGTIVITGHYRFTEPSTLEFRSETYSVCTLGMCNPYPPADPNFGKVERIEFQADASGPVNAQGLSWTRIR